MYLKEKYLIIPDELIVETAGLLETHHSSMLPSRGVVSAAPISMPGSEGSVVYFQWNAMLEPEMIGKLMILEPDVIYHVDGIYLNEYVWAEETVRDGRIVYATVIGADERTPFKKDQNIMFLQESAHRVLPPDEVPNVWAIKASSVLMYRK
jgi:hypothetical protein